MVSMHSVRAVALSLFVLPLACLILAVPARAQDDETAAKLRAMLEEMLSVQEHAQTLSGGRLVREGALTIEKAGEYYAATLPKLVMVMPDESKIDVGMIAVNAAPGEKAGLWKMTAAIPTPITAYDKAGKPVYVFDIGSQRMAGLWHETLGNFVRLDARYENSRYQDSVSGATVTLPVIEMKYDLREDANGLWSGPMEGSVRDMQVSIPQAGSSVKVKSLSYRSQLMEMSPGALAAYREKLVALGETRPDAAKGGKASDMAHTLAMYNLITEFMRTAWDGFTMQMDMEGFDAATPAAGDRPASAFHVEKAGFGFDMTGLKKDDVTVSLRLSYDGLKVEPPPPDFNELTPTTMTIDLRLGKLPLGALLEAGQKGLQGAVAAPDMAQLQAMQILAVLPGILTKAGTHVALSNSSMSNEHFSATFDGAAMADMNAAQGVTAKGKAEISGLETLIERINKDLQAPGLSGADKAALQQKLQGLTLLQTMGQQGTNAAGKPVRTYDLVIDAQGRMLLNGSDMSALMGGMGGGGTGAQQPPQAAPAP